MKCVKHNEDKIQRGNKLRCRSCQIASQKRHYLNHRVVEIAKRQERRDRIRSEQYKLLAEIKNVPCMDCNQKFPPYVMEFDHINGDKEYNVSAMVGVAWSKVLKEISKCEIVCSNCHRVRTYKLLWRKG